MLFRSYPLMTITVVTMFAGLFVIIILSRKNIKGAVLLGIFFASVMYWTGEAILFGINPFESLAGASFIPPVVDMFATTFFKFNFPVFIRMGWLSAFTVVITFCMIDIFDTLGTLVGTAQKSGMIDNEGNMPNMKEVLVSDAIGTLAGSVTGTSTVTTYIESASGVAAGGRTGLDRKSVV